MQIYHAEAIKINMGISSFFNERSLNGTVFHDNFPLGNL